MKPFSAALIGLVLVLAASNTAHAAVYNYYTGFPANYTPSGINDAGSVVGGAGLTGGHSYSFILSGGTYALFDYPGASLTSGAGISNAGTIVGNYSDSNDVSYGFTLSNGAYASLAGYSGASYTGFKGINNAGTIVGFYWDDQGKLHGFTMDGGAYSSVDYSGGSAGTAVYGINDAGAVVGTYSDGTKQHGFTLGNGASASIDYPGAKSTSAYGVNDAGTIVGSYIDANNVSHGFVLNSGSYTTVDRQGATGTVLWGINSAGTIIGTDSKGVFMATAGVTLSGTVTAEKCTADSCATAPFPGVLIGAASSSASYQATTATDGTYSVQVAPGKTYTLTPSYTTDVGFSPPSLTTTPTASVNNLDFIACVTQLPTEADLEADFLASLVRKPMVAANACDPDALDWAMPAKLIQGVTMNSTSSNGVLDHNDIYPPSGWDVDLFLTSKGVPDAAPSCFDPNTQWRWTVTGPSKVLKQPAPGCKTSMTVQQLGTYNVTARKYTRSSSKAAWTPSNPVVKFSKPVLARNFLIAGLGDSNGSGEGNPPFFYPKCDRSEASYQFKSALYVENQDPHSSVTFLFAACSGARIEHLYNKEYLGTNPEPGGANPLPPQIRQISQALQLQGLPWEPKNPRSVDAVILSIGINNLSFGPLAMYATKNAYRGGDLDLWPTQLVGNYSIGAGPGDMTFLYSARAPLTLGKILGFLQDDLDNLYPPLADALRAPVSSGGLGVSQGNVIITQYPDFSHDANGNTCDTATNWTGLYHNADVPQWNKSDWSWFSLQGATLNKHVANTNSTCGWTVAKLDNTATGPFGTHGYCAGAYKVVPFSPIPPFVLSIPSFGQSYFLGVIAGNIQKNPKGPFHPLDLGHQITAAVVEPPLCNALFGNPTCAGPPPK